MQSEESNALVKLAKAVIEHAPEGGDAFWGIKFSDIEAALSAAEPVGAPLELPYRNWRGEISTRKIQPIRLDFGATEWHPEPQWLLVATDIEKNAERSFALKDFNPQQPAPSVAVTALQDHVLADFTHLTDAQALSGPYIVKRIKERFGSFALSAQVQDESEIVDCLLAGKPFVFDPATNFCHADDGGAPEHGIKYVPAAQVQDVAEGWSVISNHGSVLIYCLKQNGWRKGKPVMVNDIMIRVENANRSSNELQPIVDAIMRALPAAPAKQEG